MSKRLQAYRLISALHESQKLKNLLVYFAFKNYIHTKNRQEPSIIEHIRSATDMCIQLLGLLLN